MSSFLDLPPEIRLTIYKLLLQSTLAQPTRILYYGNNSLHRGDTPDCARHKQPFKRIGAQGHIVFVDTRSIYASKIRTAMYNIHLANIDDILFLASTCRVLRSEFLALVWSNADIRVVSPETYNELHYIFYERLTSESCKFIRTLQFSVIESHWSPSLSRKVVGLVRNRLTQLEQLTVNLFERNGSHDPRLSPGVAALRILPLHITVHLRYYASMRGRGSRILLDVSDAGVDRRIDKSTNKCLQSLRAEVDLIGQKRRERQSKKEQGDEVCDILEATAEMRSLMAS